MTDDDDVTMANRTFRCPPLLYSFALQRLHPAATPKHLFIEAQKNMDRQGTICFPQQYGAAACGPRAP
jgi:hypothetical protein